MSYVQGAFSSLLQRERARFAGCTRRQLLGLSECDRAVREKLRYKYEYSRYAECHWVNRIPV